MAPQQRLAPGAAASGGAPSRDRPAPARRRLAGLGLAVLSVVIFAGWFVVTRFSVTRELTIWDITALRFGIGALLLGPGLLRRGARLPPGAWRLGLLFALLWGPPFVLLVALGLRLTSAAEAASIAPTMMPVFAAVFAWAALGERQGLRRWLGYAAIVAGLAGLAAAGPALPAGGSTIAAPAGIGALALASALWAVYTLLFRRSGLTPLQAAALICVWSAMLFLPPYLLLGLGRLGRAPAGELALQAGYQGVLMSGVALAAFNRAVGLLGSGAASAIIALLPAVAALLAVLVLGEVPSPAAAIAIAVIVGRALLAARSAPAGPATAPRPG